MTAVDRIIKRANELECKAIKAAPMSEYTSFKIGGPAELLIWPKSNDDLKELIAACFFSGVSPLILGKGSNVLVSDCGIDNVVICTSELNGFRCLGDGIIECDSGTGLSVLCSFALDQGLSGLEFAYGIPGSAGGAAYMNAGAYDGEMKDVLVACAHLTSEAVCGTLEGENLEFGYRKSAYSSNGYVITSLLLKLIPCDKAEIKNRMNTVWERRKEKQPLEYPSAGSVFKRPSSGYASALIEECGLKGKQIGGAPISAKHGGFIVNKGVATANDVKALIQLVKDTVFHEKGVLLETEIKFI